MKFIQDGVLTREEMVQVLQTVLKRELTLEEAMAIAQDMVRDLIYSPHHSISYIEPFV